ncbi:MAG: ribosome-associated translation inhibitor RaiA [Campylobacterales bacterium]|jgi:putative sigma-54 modulation protein
MVVAITARHFQLTDPIKDYVSKLIGEAEKYNLGIDSCQVILTKDKRDFYNVELILHIPEKGTVVVQYTDKDFYSAVDRAKDKLEKLLRRYHDKITTYRGNREEIPLLIEAPIEGEEEIVEMPLDFEKPLSIEEAVEQFKKSGLYFFVFRDKKGEKRVLYRRRDGKLGLY